MIEEPEGNNDQLKEICEIPHNVNVYDMAFDWVGKKLAVACSDKTIRIYQKKSNDLWAEENPIKVQGPAVWKVKWSKPEFGIILLTCQRDSTIRTHQLKRKDWSQSKKNEWDSREIKREANKCIEDLKFIPNKDFGLAISFVSANEGFLKIISSNQQKKISSQSYWNTQKKLQISELGLNCLSWNKDSTKKYSLVAIGCKSHQTTPKRTFQGLKLSQESQPRKIQPINTIAFATFNNKELQRVQCPAIKQNKAINDISWALINGRSYSLLGVASDAGLKIFEINIKESGSSMQIDVINFFNLGEQRPCYRLTFNVMGTMISAAEKKKVRLFKAIERSSWGEIKMLQDKEI